MAKTARKRTVLILTIPVLFLCVAGVCVFMYLFGTGRTTTGYRFDYKLDDVLEAYEDFKNAVDLEQSFAIPGLARTNVTPGASVDLQGRVTHYEPGNGHSTRYMVPQGLCFAEDFIVISAYDSKSIYHSVLYILDRQTGAYLTTILLEDKNHVGGIACDGERIWIAKSGDNALSAISCERLKIAASLDEDCVGLAYDMTCDINCKASFVTYYDGLLWVGVFEKNSENVSVLRGFSYEESHGVMGLFLQDELFLPELANGAAIENINGHVCLIVDSSYGRNSASEIHVYELHMDENNFESAVCALKYEYVFPPLVEEVEFYDGQIYFVFESAATKYSLNRLNRCKYPVDRVCAVNYEKLLAWTSDSYVREEEILETETEQTTGELRYDVSTSRKSKRVPTYIMTGNEYHIQMLYNPYTAKMLFGILEDLRKLPQGNVVGTYSWNDTLSKNGYSNLQFFRHETLVLSEHAQTPVDIVTGIARQSAYNDKEKFNILIGIQTTDEELMRTDLLQADISYENGVACPFLNNVISLYDRLLQLTFDVPFLTQTNDGYAYIYRTVSFADILEEMKEKDSRYTLTISGQGMAGSLAQLLSGMLLPEQGIYEGNINCYTFGALAVVKQNKYEGTNIFNVINSDDMVCEFQKNTMLGDNIFYQADEAFYAKYYGYAYVPYFADTSHSMVIYQAILDSMEENLQSYVQNNTESPGTFQNNVIIDSDCFANFANLTVNGLLNVKTDVCMFVGNNLRTQRLRVSGEVKVHGLLHAKYVEIENGIVSVDGDCFIAIRQNGTEGSLRITGEVGRLDIYGNMTIPYFRYSSSTGKHIFWYGKEKADD